MFLNKNSPKNQDVDKEQRNSLIENHKNKYKNKNKSYFLLFL